MSSSLGNNIPLTAPPEEQFGRTMRIPDELLDEWCRLVAEQRRPDGEPMEAKLALARCIVARSHGRGGARRGRGALHARRPRAARRPTTCPRSRSRRAIRSTCRRSSSTRFGVGSTSEARRLIAQGGVKLDGEPVDRDRRAARASPARSSRSASGASRGLTPLDERRCAAILPRPSERAA